MKPEDLPTVEMYDPDTDTWTPRADMPTPRNTSACVVDGKIYVIGGTSDKVKSFRLDTVEVYDPDTDTWAKGKNMNVRVRVLPSVLSTERFTSWAAPDCNDSKSSGAFSFQY